MKYQLLPPLTADEYESLKQNIKDRGVLQPVVVDEHGDIVDGHHRAQVCDELGIEYPRIVVEGLTEIEKVEQALVLNLGRRHLTQEQRRDLVVKLSGDGHSVRWIAKATGISKSTVGRYLAPVPDGTPEQMTRAEAEDLTRRINDGLAFLVSDLGKLTDQNKELVVETVVDDLLGKPESEPRDWWIGWLLSLPAMAVDA